MYSPVSTPLRTVAHLQVIFSVLSFWFFAFGLFATALNPLLALISIFSRLSGLELGEAEIKQNATAPPFRNFLERKAIAQSIRLSINSAPWRIFGCSLHLSTRVGRVSSSALFLLDARDAYARATVIFNSASHVQNRYDRDWKETVLACDGGGIRGYVTLLILKSLMQEIADVERSENQALRHQEHISGYNPHDDPLKQRLPLPYHYFDYIVGTSTGGLIAIMLARLRMNVSDCITEYKKLGRRVFGKSRRFHYYKYNHRMLHDGIVEVVEKWCLDPESPRNGLDKMLHPGSTCRTVVLAVEKREGHKDEIHPFTSYAYERPEGEGDLSPRSPLNPALVYIHAAAQATSAAPGFFREANVLGDLFMDGAIMANNPSRWAWKEVWDMHFARRISANGCNPGPSSTVTEDHQNASQCPIGAFVSLGTGLRAPRSAFRRGDPLKKIRALLGKAIGDMTDTEEVHRDLQDRAGKLNKKLYYRFNPEGLEKMRLDECKSHDRTFHDMDTAWTRYVEKINVKRSLHECAQELVRQRRSRVSKEELLRFHDLTKLESRP